MRRTEAALLFRYPASSTLVTEEDVEMDQARASGLPENALFGALELSKDGWLLAIQFPDHRQPSLYPIKGGDATGLTAKLLSARDRWAKVSGEMPSIPLCYEAGCLLAVPRGARHRVPGGRFRQPAGQPARPSGEDRSHRCAHAVARADRLVPG